jgi:ATP synthase protein I
MTDRGQFSTVKKILILQALVTIIIPIGFIIFAGLEEAMSPALGGIVALIPNIYFAYRVYLASGKPAIQLVRAFYLGEAIKISLTVALFCVVYQIPGINFLALFFAYVAVLSVHWFALIL